MDLLPTEIFIYPNQGAEGQKSKNPRQRLSQRSSRNVGNDEKQIDKPQELSEVEQSVHRVTREGYGNDGPSCEEQDWNSERGKPDLKTALLIAINQPEKEGQP